MRQQSLFLALMVAVVSAIAFIAFLSVHHLLRPKREISGPQGLRVWRVTLYFPDLKADRLVRHPITLSATDEKHAVAALVEHLKNPFDLTLSPALPKETQLLDARREGSLLSVDFNAAFADPTFWQGSEVAHLRLQALIYTLTSLPEVQRVRILIDGQTPPALGGHEDVTEPLIRDPSLSGW